MSAKFLYFWHLVRDSYWFLPSLMMIGAILLSFGMLELDHRTGADVIDELGWTYAGGPDGARAVLSTIAGSMITVAGVVFSITIVALTLASSQFGPRILSRFMQDRGNQVVLGTFTATFLYCLLVLRVVRGSAEGIDEAVPQISVTVGSALALVSLGFLIFFIHHVATSIQAPNLIAEIAGELHEGIEEMFPEDGGAGGWAGRESPPLPDGFAAEARAVSSHHNGYLEAIDLARLMDLAVASDVVIRLERRPGHFAVKGETLALVWPGDRLDDELARRIRDNIVVGPRRTKIQDVEFPMDQLVEIAVRSLSPGINDPFTASNCIDQLGAALCHLAARPIPSPFRVDAEGRLRIVSTRPLTYAGLVDTALNQIRQNTSYHASVYIRTLETIATALSCARDDGHRTPLLRHAELVLRQGTEQIVEREDREELTARYRELTEAARQRHPAAAARAL